MSGHIFHKINRFGASRNLVIRHAKADMTSRSIRDDLEHIHNLEVVQISILPGEVYVSLNSVHHATVARNCMQSRLKYKGCRIDFYADECDQPLPEIVKRAPKEVHPPVLKTNNAGTNRFQILDSGDSDHDDDSEIAQDSVQLPEGLHRSFAALGVAA
jgi:hypothetical protein